MPLLYLFEVTDSALSSMTLSCRGWPSGQLPFLLRQKRRPHSRCPSCFRLCKSKNGKPTKLATLRQRSLLIPFSASHKQQPHSGSTSTAVQRQFNGNSIVTNQLKNPSLLKIVNPVTLALFGEFFCFCFCFWVLFWLFVSSFDLNRM